MDTIKKTRQSLGWRRGFTLMELLVVISIICLLMAIALPSLTSAREQGKRVTCLANMKNLSYSWLMFTHDNDDRLVSADTDWDVPPADHWVADGPFMPDNEVGGTERAIRAGRLWPYTGESVDLYKCHSDASERLRSYAIARAMNGKTCNCEHDNINPFRLYSQISMPSDRLVFADAATKLSWIEGSFCQVKEIDAIPPTWFVRTSRNITARHGDGCNLSFADGSCRSWKYRDKRTIALANWELGPDEASEYNVDLDRMVQLLRGKRK
jgi:prepilin-type N-terminal cleavage/methylation domain-containing protein/prepilin-type processing-associated H-X9-DG protein